MLNRRSLFRWLGVGSVAAVTPGLAVAAAIRKPKHIELKETVAPAPLVSGIAMMMWVEQGRLMYRGSQGTVTVLGPA